MSRLQLPPPDPAACLDRPYASRAQKGGTLLAEHIADLPAHQRALADPEGYRPACCPSCGGTTLHRHDARERILRSDPLADHVLIRVFCCADCSATWRVLPGFLARHLHGRWPVVEAATLGPQPAPAAPQVPTRTRRRWRARLLLSACVLVQVLAQSASALLLAVVTTTGLLASRGGVLLAYAALALLPPGEKLGALAVLIHRLEPGVRLM
jgi:hypothetical protein